MILIRSEAADARIVTYRLSARKLAQAQSEDWPVELANS